MASESNSRDWSKEHEKDEVFIPIPPDGGFGWVIVCTSFICSFVLDGTIYSFGKILPGLVESLNLTNSKAASIGSIQCGMYYLCGPLVCAIVNKYGFRIVAFIGAIFAVAGLVGASYCEDVNMLILCYCIVGGIGYCMVYSPSIIILGFYFEKYRAIATGIAMCGSSLGTVCVSPLFTYFMDTYGWQRTFQMQACLLVLCGICTLTFRSIEPAKVEVEEDEHVHVHVKANLKKEKVIAVEGNVSQHLRSVAGPKQKVWVEKSISIISLNAARGVKRIHSRLTHLNQKEIERPHWCNDLFCCCGADERPNEALIKMETSRPLQRQDIFFNQSLKRIPAYRNHSLASHVIHHRNEPLQTIDEIKYQLSNMHIPKVKQIQRKPKRFQCSEYFLYTLNLVFDFSLMKSLTFNLIAINCSFWLFGILPIYIYITARATDAGISRLVSNWLISYLSIGNTFGRISSGIMSFLPDLDAVWVTFISTVLAGILTIIAAVYGSDNEIFLIFYAIVFGYLIAFCVCLRTVIFCDYLGLEKLTSAYGMSSFAVGIASLVATPIAGHIIDATGDFVYAYLMAGIGLIICGFSIIILKCIGKPQIK